MNKSYSESLIDLIEIMRVDLKEAIEEAAAFIGDVMMNEGIIQLYAWGSNNTLSMELGYRAGGLIQYHQMSVRDLALRGQLSYEEFTSPDLADRKDLAPLFFDTYKIDPRDAFLVTQIGEASQVSETMVQEIKDRGFKFLLVTNTQVPGLKESKAYTLADHIIDLNVAYPDHTRTLANGLKIGPTANLLGNIVAQMLTAEVYRYLINQDASPGLLLSANISGADEHNRALGEKYDGRYNS